MAGIEVEPELLASAEGLEGPFGGDQIVGDLRGVDLEREADAAFGKHVEDWVPAFGELGESGVDHRHRHRREAVEKMPDRRSGEAVDDTDAELLGGPRRPLHLLGRAAVHAVGVAVSPHVRRQDRLMTLVDSVADRLADEVGGDGVDGELVALELIALLGAVRSLLECPRGVEVVAPAGQLESLVAELAGFAGEIVEGQIGPLAGEQRDRTWHGGTPDDGEGRA